MKKNKSKKPNSKKFIKIGAGIISIVLVGVLVGLQFFTSSASDRFPGVDTMISQVNASQDRQYTILEVVPDAGMGEIGFYVPGEEYNYITELLEQQQGQFATRKLAYEFIRGKLIDKGICAPDNATDDEKVTYPVSGGLNYDEKIFLSDGDEGYQELTLKIPEDQNLTGSFVATNTGEGDYKRTSDVNGVIYSSGTGQYDVTFVTGINKDGTNADPASTATVHPNWSNYGAYELCADGSYKKVSNTYRSSNDWYISTITENTHVIGNYNLTYAYSYDKGNGDYKFVPDENGSMCKVPIGHVYYKVDFTNNELFRKQIFGLTDDDISQMSHFGINVETVTVTELQTMELTALSNLNFDMLYLSGDTNLLDLPATKTYKECITEDTPDISYERMESILGLIYETLDATGYRSVMINYHMFDKVASGIEKVEDSNIYKLATICLQTDAYDVYTDQIYGEDESGIDWDGLWNSNLAKDDTKSVQHNYVKDNVYSFYKLTDVDMTGLDQTMKSLTHGLVHSYLASDVYDADKIVKIGFSEITALVNQENASRPTGDKLSVPVTQARAIQYIINAWNPRQTELKTTIRVLELQPCYSFDLTVAKVKTWADDLVKQVEDTGAKVDIEIDQMTTSEFIGKIDDLNTTYDLIYIGVNTGRMNTENGRTVYNDKNMKGLVYTHIGDIVKVNDELQGILAKDYLSRNYSNYLFAQGMYKSSTEYTYNRENKTFTVTAKPVKMGQNIEQKENDPGMARYSGNDLTTYKRDELKDYLNGHYAMVLDARLLDASSTDGVSDSYVDNASYMYEFLKTASKNKDSNVITCDTAQTLSADSAQRFNTYLNMNKPSLDNFVDNKDDPSKNITCSFTITNTMETDYNTAYGLNLFVDINADGQYSTKEIIRDCIITNADGEAEKDSVGNYILRSNVRYTLTKNLGSSYVGYLPYKVEVYNSAEGYTSIRTSETSAKKTTGAQAETIRILQIKQRSDTGHNNNLDMATDTDFGSVIDQAEKLCNYNIEITAIAAEEYEKQFNAYAKDGKNYIDVKGFNMLVLGFADVYSDLSNTIASHDSGTLQMSPLGGVLDFINDGKSVLFTHDATSFVNVSTKAQLTTTLQYNGEYNTGLNSGVAYWGYNINSILRSVVGMDRFNVTSNSTISRGELLNFSSSSQTGLESVDKQALIAAGVHDFSYVANGSQLYATGETQGFTNALLDANSTGESKYKSLRKKVNDSDYDGNVMASGNGEYSSLHVSQVNTGQITEYPFKINSDIAVANTHYQYYQLDLEADDDNDGKSDIVVWYTLAQTGTDTSKNNTAYTASPHDVRNNYYIYSKGNVMYSGVGHSKMNSKGDEMQLFVNTMIAAYKNGVQAPTATIKENSDITSPAKTNEYLTFDSSISENGGSLDSDLTMYYEVEDANLVSSGTKDISVRYFVENEFSTNEIPETGVKGDEITDSVTTYPVSSNSPIENNKVNSGSMYQVTIPSNYAYLDSTQSTKRIFVVLTSKFNYYGVDQEVNGSTSLTLQKTQLFELK